MVRPWAGSAAIAFCVLAATIGFNGAQAQQVRSAAAGVYSQAQARRGAELYKARCVACHGAPLAGDIAPPLAGEAFLGVWGGTPASDLFDKIQNTMPADAPGTLSRPQVADLVAFILQANKFPAGGAELGATEAALQQVSLGDRINAVVPAAAASFAAVGTLNQVMRGVLFPSSNVLFDVQTQDPGARKTGARADAATTTARYGDVYEPWQVVDAAAIAIAESGPMLMTPGRRCENGKPVPIDRADWQKYVKELVETGRAAYRASQRRNPEAVSEVTNQISDACANCHRVYRDVASAAMRCTVP
jgi:mono/diheme cytochrome c family protein